MIIYIFKIAEKEKVPTAKAWAPCVALPSSFSGVKTTFYLHHRTSCLVPQECWAADLNQVRELMTIFIDDTMRKTNDPVFTVSEVIRPAPQLPLNRIVSSF